jgi:apolipoprotein N-acyltransferase
MTANVGTIDRVARIVVGLVLIAFAIPLGFPQTDWNWVGWIGVVPLLTAIVGVCPAYSLLGVTTCPLVRKTG